MHVRATVTGSALAVIASVVLVACTGVDDVDGTAGTPAPSADRPASASAAPAAATSPAATSARPLSARQQKAIRRATSWVASYPSSEAALVFLLQREGFTDEEARYAATHIGADYKAEAFDAAKDHLDAGPITEWMLIKTLEMDGFPTADAEAAVAALDADWTAEAVEAAKEKVRLNPGYYTRSSLIDELVREKFTEAQATAAATAAGL